MAASVLDSDSGASQGEIPGRQWATARCARVSFGVPYTRSEPGATPMPIGKATNVAIDDTILDRMQRVMPSYHSRKAFINQLLDEAITLREELMSRNSKTVAE
jgi:hypothetical protein